MEAGWTASRLLPSRTWPYRCSQDQPNRRLLHHGRKTPNTCGWNRCTATINDDKEQEANHGACEDHYCERCRTKECLPRVSGNQSHNLPEINMAQERSGSYQTRTVCPCQTPADIGSQHLETVLKARGRKWTRDFHPSIVCCGEEETIRGPCH